MDTRWRTRALRPGLTLAEHGNSWESTGDHIAGRHRGWLHRPRRHWIEAETHPLVDLQERGCCGGFERIREHEKATGVGLENRSDEDDPIGALSRGPRSSQLGLADVELAVVGCRCLHLEESRSSEIDWLEIELFLTKLLERGLSPKTARETPSVLSQIMKTALRGRVIRENPAAGHSMPTRRQRTPVPTMQQVDASAVGTVWSPCDGHRLGAAHGLGQRGSDVGEGLTHCQRSEDGQWFENNPPRGMADRRSRRGRHAPLREHRRAGRTIGPALHLAEGQANAGPHAVAHRQPSMLQGRLAEDSPIRPEAQPRLLANRHRRSPQGHQRTGWGGCPACC